MIRDDDWRASAACRDVDPEVFFPPEPTGGSYRPEDVDAAREVCAPCPVRLDCLVDARTEDYGLWAGTTPDDRRGLRLADRDAFAPDAFAPEALAPSDYDMEPTA